VVEVVMMPVMVLEVMPTVPAAVVVGEGRGGERKAPYGSGGDEDQFLQHCGLL
jgi:hypothetical protein